MERTNRRLLLVALLFALLAGLGAFKFLTSIQSMATVKYTEAVVVAVRDIPARTAIRNDMVAIERVPKGMRHTRGATSLDQVIGKVITQPIVAGEQVLTDRLFASVQQSGLAFQLENGQRAVSININQQIAVAYLARPGDRIDVMLSYESPSSKQPTTVTILQNILVLAIGSELRQGTQAPSDSATMTLAVTPDQAERIIWAEDYGKIRLVLRPSTDQQLISTPGQTIQSVVGGR